MTENMIRTQVYLPREIYEKLKLRAESEGTAMATQIREALSEYVVKSTKLQSGQPIPEDDPIWDMIGMVDSGVTDGSVNHDKYIYTRDWDLPENKK
ncbi:MAG: ribbon-helix-helix protein, CopG family [Chloroflexi bacterium]|nr:ribbon-helix-helix protein, CopG family [Chloroflexota bacterium]